MSQKFGSFQGTGNTKYLNYNGSVTSGDIWFDHSNAAIKIYNGTSWDEVGSGSGGGGITYSVHTSNVTATANQGIIADTSGGSFTVTLPASPTTGDKVFIADGADFSTNNLTVARNGSTIEGASEDFVMDIGGPNVGFIYDGTTWQVYPQSGLMGLRGIDDNATSTAITIDASENVGIGTSTPDAKIHGAGSQGSGDVPFIFENSATSGVATSSIVFAGNGGSGAEKARIKSAVYGDGYMAFHTNNDTEKMRIDASGNVGIGTTNPLNQLVISEGTGQHGIEFAAGTTSYIQAYDRAISDYGDLKIDAQIIQFGTDNGTERMRISSGGDVQIGTAAVTGGRYFDIYNTGSTATDFAITRLITQQVGSASTTSADIIKRKNGQFGFINNDTNAAAYINFKVGASERMRIDSSGRLLLNTTDATTGGLNPTVNFKQLSNASYHRGMIIESADSDAFIGIGYSGSEFEIGASYRASAGYKPITVVAGGYERMRIDTSGRVGIGTSSPVGSLHVLGGNAGTSNWDNEATVSSVSINVQDRIYNAYSIRDGENIKAAGIGYSFNNSNGYKLYLGTASSTTSGLSTGLTLDGSGNVGIGTTSPSVKLTIEEDTSAILMRGKTHGNTTFLGYDTNQEFAINTQAGGIDLFTALTNGGDITFTPNASEAMRITTTGNLLVNTTSQYGSQKISVNGGIAIDGRSAATPGLCEKGDTDTGVFWPTTNTLGFSTVGTERVRIDAGGNLLVGATSASAKFQVTHSSAATPVALLQNTNGATSGVGGVQTSLNSTANNTNCFHFKGTTQGVASYFLYGNGTSSFTSDERQKKNIVATRDGYLDDLKRLRVVDYHWNTQEDTEDKSVGLIAQEVEQVFPHLVIEHEMEGVGPRKNLRGSEFTFVLIKAIQEQQAMIDELKAEVAALKGE